MSWLWAPTDHKTGERHEDAMEAAERALADAAVTFAHITRATLNSNLCADVDAMRARLAPHLKRVETAEAAARLARNTYCRGDPECDHIPDETPARDLPRRAEPGRWFRIDNNYRVIYAPPGVPA